MDSVYELFYIAGERGISWEEVRELGDDQVYSLFYPERNV